MALIKFADNGNLESPQGILIADGSNDMIENSIIYNPSVRSNNKWRYRTYLH